MVELKCYPNGGDEWNCPNIKVGDYLMAEGYQGDKEQGHRFIAEDIEVLRGGIAYGREVPWRMTATPSSSSPPPGDGSHGPRLCKSGTVLMLTR